MKPTDRLELRTVAFALLASLLLWNLPFGGVLLYPFKLLATWLHEASHGLAMMVTGVGFDHVTIYRDTSGLAYGTSEAGGVSSAVIAAAGYMGTPLWGAVLLVVTPNARMARWALLWLGALLVGTAITVIGTPDGDLFGPLAVGSIGAACAIAAFAVPAPWRLAIAHFIAAQSCVNAILDIRVLLRPSQVVGGKVAGASDAHNMAMATFGTSATWAVWLWASVWLVWSLTVLYAALRLSGSRALAEIAPASIEPATPRHVASASSVTEHGATAAVTTAADQTRETTPETSVGPELPGAHDASLALVASAAPESATDGAPELVIEQTAGTRPGFRRDRSRRAAARKIPARRGRWFRGPGSQ